jgi:hypothetical protein
MAPSPIKLQFEIPGYDILAKIGEGASATVWRARQRSLDRFVAIKVLRHELSSDPEEIDDFLREARVVASIKHPNMVPIYDVGQTDGRPYFVMELIEGRTLGEQIRKHGPIPEAQALAYAEQIAAPLAHAWDARHLIHRDVKADNILLDHGSQVRVADLGIAGIATPTGLSETTNRTLVGTPNYMSPEQAQCDPKVDYRADIYSLGCLLYEMVTGKLPFADLETDQVLTGQITRTIDSPRKLNPAISPACAELIRRMMMKLPKHRYDSWKAAIKEIEIAAAGKKLPTRGQFKSTISPISSGGITPIPVAPGKIGHAANRAAKAQARPTTSPALPVFLKVFALIALGAWAYRLLDLPPAPRLNLTPVKAPASALHQPAPQPIPQPAPAAAPANPGLSPEASFTQVMNALMASDPGQARDALRAAMEQGLDREHVSAIGTFIDAADSADRLVLRGFQASIGQDAELQVGTRRLSIIVKSVNASGVTAAFLLPDGQQRETTFKISKLTGVEQSRWVGAADTPIKSMAKTILLMRGGNLPEARDMAAKTGDLAALLAAEIDTRIARLTE